LKEAKRLLLKNMAGNIKEDLALKLKKRMSCLKAKNFDITSMKKMRKILLLLKERRNGLEKKLKDSNQEWMNDDDSQ